MRTAQRLLFALVFIGGVALAMLIVWNMTMSGFFSTVPHPVIDRMARLLELIWLGSTLTLMFILLFFRRSLFHSGYPRLAFLCLSSLGLLFAMEHLDGLFNPLVHGPEESPAAVVYLAASTAIVAYRCLAGFTVLWYLYRGEVGKG